MIKHAVLLCLTIMILFSPTPASADGSGQIAWTCDVTQAKHYANKGQTLAGQHSYHDALFAFSAAIAAIKTCKTVSFNPVWMYWVHTEEALMDAITGDYFDANAVLVAAEFWKNRISSSLGPDDAKSVAWSDKTVSFVKTAIANYRSGAASRTYQPPVPKSYSSCDSDTIDSVSDDGSVVTMLSGATYSIADVDQATSSTWLSSDDVIVCDQGDHFEIIDKDQDSDHVDGQKIE